MADVNYYIHSKNLPPNFGWVHSCWLAVLTVRVFDGEDFWYWIIGCVALLLLIGTVSLASKAKFIDLFERLK